MLAFGRDTYLRLHPNPGLGVRLGNARIALSALRGLEVFVRNGPDGAWKLRWRRANVRLRLKKWRP